jgi:hypothetical protein
MKKPKPVPVSTQLDPSHPNYDAILLKRARLEAHRRRRLENRGEIPPQDRPKAPAKKAVKPAKKAARGKKS